MNCTKEYHNDLLKIGYEYCPECHNYIKVDRHLSPFEIKNDLTKEQLETRDFIIRYHQGELNNEETKEIDTYTNIVLKLGDFESIVDLALKSDDRSALLIMLAAKNLKIPFNNKLKWHRIVERIVVYVL
jgi:hypothetical protein